MKRHPGPTARAARRLDAPGWPTRAEIRSARRNNLGGDVPWIIGAVLAVGALAGAAVGFLVDLALHRHRAV